MEAKPKLYQCPECGLHYTSTPVAKKREAYCKKHNGFNLEITKLPVDRSKS